MPLCMTNDLFREALQQGKSFTELEILYSLIGNPSRRIRSIKNDLKMNTAEAVDFLLGIEYYLSHDEPFDRSS
jgi:hypothetical protein